MRLILIVLIVLLLVGALPAWPYSAQWGYPPALLILVILIVVLLFG
jgi:hypothetical protein